MSKPKKGGSAKKIEFTTFAFPSPTYVRTAAGESTQGKSVMAKASFSPLAVGRGEGVTVAVVVSVGVAV